MGAYPGSVSDVPPHLRDCLAVHFKPTEPLREEELASLPGTRVRLSQDNGSGRELMTRIQEVLIRAEGLTIYTTFTDMHPTEAGATWQMELLDG